jgi:hypothetical protein
MEKNKKIDFSLASQRTSVTLHGRARVRTRMTFLLRQTPWSGAGVYGILLSGFLLAPSVARAECGSYVVMGAGSTNDHQADSQLLAGSMASAVHPSPLHPSSRHRPCSGPGCKQAPVTPPLAPVMPPPVIEKESGHLAGAILLGTDDRSGCVVVFPSERPFHRTNSIYHPPRFSVG